MSHHIKEAIGRLKIYFFKLLIRTKYRRGFLIEDTKLPNHNVKIVKFDYTQKNKF